MIARRPALIGAAAVVVLLAGVLAALVRDAGDGSSSPGAERGASPSASPSATSSRPSGTGATSAVAGAGEEPVTGGVLRIGLSRPRSFDPGTASPADPAELLVADLLFDGLTAVPQGSAEPGEVDGPAAPEVVGALAESWSASDDLLRWTFVLRDDARFADGRPITAGDVKYSLERVAKRGDTSLAAARLEVIAGYDEWVSGTAGELAGVVAVDERTVEIATAAPFAVLPALLSAPNYGVIEADPGGGGDPVGGGVAGAVGSGPFAMVGADANVVRLVRTTNGSAYLDGVELHLFDGPSGAYEAFVAGTVDYAVVPPNRLEDAVSRFGVDAFRPFHATVLYAFNVASPGLADPRFRQAIVHAIDRRAIVTALGGLGTAVAPGLVPATAGGPSGGVACLDACDHDPALARQLVAEAFPAGDVPAVAIDYDASPENETMARAMEAGLADVGIPVERRAHAPAEYDRFATSGEQHLFRLAWIGLYPSPDGYLAPLLLSGSRDNPTGLSSEQLDGMLAAARATVDSGERARRYAEAERWALEQAVVVPFEQRLTTAVVGPRVRGLELGVGGTFDGGQVWLAG